jgi:amino acid permease
MLGITKKLTARWQKVANFLLAISLIVSPWAFAYADHTAAALNATLTGVAIALVAVLAPAAYEEWQEWITAALAGWLIVSPYLLGFGTMHTASWTHVIVGVLVAVLTLWAGITARYGGSAASKS